MKAGCRRVICYRLEEDDSRKVYDYWDIPEARRAKALGIIPVHCDMPITDSLPVPGEWANDEVVRSVIYGCKAHTDELRKMTSDGKHPAPSKYWSGRKWPIEMVMAYNDYCAAHPEYRDRRLRRVDYV